MTSRWYVVQTQPHAETKAMGHLIRQGFAAYLPRYLKRRRHARKTEMVAAPLFPRYLFVAVDMETQRWRSIHSTFGVSRLVCNGDEPAPVPPAVVTALQGREDAGGFVQLERLHFRRSNLFSCLCRACRSTFINPASSVGRIKAYAIMAKERLAAAPGNPDR